MNVKYYGTTNDIITNLLGLNRCHTTDEERETVIVLSDVGCVSEQRLELSKQFIKLDFSKRTYFPVKVPTLLLLKMSRTTTVVVLS